MLVRLDVISVKKISVFFSFFLSFPFKFVLLQLCRVYAFGLGEELLSLFFCMYFAGDVILFHGIAPPNRRDGERDGLSFSL